MSGWAEQRWSLATARLVLYVIGLLLIWQIARVILLALGGPVVPPARIGELPRIAPQSVTVNSGLGQWHLFGRAPQRLDLTALAALPDTPLALTLRGIVAATGETNEGYALIADERGREDVYRRGDDVPGGAEVISIQPDQVILQREGRRETLRLPGGAPTSRGPVADAVAQNSDNVAGQRLVNTLPGIRAPKQPLTVSTNVPGLSGLQFNTAALANAIQVAPVSGGGFRVFPGRNASIFQQLGLRANDVVTQVNGRPLASQADALAIFQAAQSGQQITITVRRGGQELTLKPDISNFTQQ